MSSIEATVNVYRGANQSEIRVNYSSGKDKVLPQYQNICRIAENYFLTPTIQMLQHRLKTKMPEIVFSAVQYHGEDPNPVCYKMH